MTNKLPILPAKNHSVSLMRGARGGCDSHFHCWSQSLIATYTSSSSYIYFTSNYNFRREAWGVDSENHNKNLITLQQKREVLSKSIKLHDLEDVFELMKNIHYWHGIWTLVYRHYWILWLPWDRAQIVTKSNKSQNPITVKWPSHREGGQLGLSTQLQEQHKLKKSL